MMKTSLPNQSLRTLTVLTVVALAGVSSQQRAAAAEPAGAHDKLFVLDVKLGMPLDGRPGFTCTKEKRTASGDREERHCVQFVDDRCKGRPAGIGAKRYGEKAPKGCYLDHSSHATYLDDLLMQDPNTGDSSQARNGRKPLANVHLLGTRSTPSKIYEIEYMFAEDDLLDENSKLHKALIAKYGEPTEIHSGKMKWRLESTELVAQCTPNQNCSIDVEDRKLRENVEDEQNQADAQKKRDAAPTPKL